MSFKLETMWNWKVSGHRATIEAANKVMASYRNTGTVLKSVTDAQRNQSKALYAARRSIHIVRMQYRIYNAVLIEQMRLLRNVATMGRTILYIQNALNISAIRLTEAREREADATKDAAHYQKLYAHYTDVLGNTSVIALDMADKLTKAKEREADAQRDVTRAINAQRISYVGAGLAALDLVTQVHNIYMRTRMLKDMAGYVGLGTAAGTGAAAAGQQTLGGTAAAGAGVGLMGKAGGLLKGLAAANPAGAFLLAMGILSQVTLNDERREKAFADPQRQYAEAQTMMSAFRGGGFDVDPAVVQTNEILSEIKEIQDYMGATMDDVSSYTAENAENTGGFLSALSGIPKGIAEAIRGFFKQDKAGPSGDTDDEDEEEASDDPGPSETPFVPPIEDPEDIGPDGIPPVGDGDEDFTDWTPPPPPSGIPSPDPNEIPYNPFAPPPEDPEDAGPDAGLGGPTIINMNFGDVYGIEDVISGVSEIAIILDDISQETE